MLPPERAESQEGQGASSYVMPRVAVSASLVATLPARHRLHRAKLHSRLLDARPFGLFAGARGRACVW